MKKTNEKIFITGIGCESAEINVVRIKEYLKLNNYLVVETPKEANTCILSACVATEGALTNILEFTSKLKKINPNMRIIFAGCGPKVMPKVFSDFEYFSGYEDVEKIFIPKTIRFSEVALDGLPISQMKIALRNSTDLGYKKINYEILKTVFERLDKTVANLAYVGYVSPKSGLDFSYRILISQGCMFRCSYCIIWKAVAPFRSLSKENILSQIERGYKQGYKSFILINNDSYNYGIDIYKKRSFNELLKDIFKRFPDAKFGISYLSTSSAKDIFNENTIDFYSKHLFYVLVSIQSGSKRIIKKMNRPENLDILQKTLINFRKKFKGILDTQLIYGFPGETEEDIQTTIDYVKKVGFDNFKASKFSPRPETPLENEKPCKNSSEHGRVLETTRKYLQTNFLRRLFSDLLKNKPTLGKTIIHYNSKKLPKEISKHLKTLSWSEWKNETEQIFVNESFPDFKAIFRNTEKSLRFILGKNLFTLQLKENEMIHIIWILKDIFGTKNFVKIRRRTSNEGDIEYSLTKTNNQHFLEIIKPLKIIK